MCTICGQPDYLRCNCQSAQPFCDQCAEDTRCGQVMDAQCIIYHYDTQQPSQLTCLGIQNGASLEDILEAIDDLVCNSFNIPFEPEDTESIVWTPGGPSGHKPKADVRISPDEDNGLVLRENGLFAVGDGKVKVDADDEPDYLENQMIGGSSPSGLITIETVNQGGIMAIIPSLDISVLLQVIQQQFNEEFCEIIDSCKCFLQIENLIATFAPACPDGYVLNEEGTLCVGENEVPATITLPIITACPQFRAEYSAYGSLVYNGGFNTSGEGASGHVLNGLLTDVGAGNVTQLLTANVWQSDNSTGNNNGPANRAGIWICPYDSPNTLGFVVPVNVPASKVYYIAVAADNDFRIDVDGVVVVDSSTTDTIYWNDGGAKFRYWHIYPVNLTTGIRYIGISGIDTGVQGMLAAEIYDNTLSELQAAALEPAFVSDPTTFPFNQNHYSNLDLLFTTRCARASGTFSIGNATCPPGFNLDTTGGGPLVAPCQGINGDTSLWVCRQTITVPFSGYTVTLVWDRIPNAIEYQVQQKLSSDPDSAWVDVSTSPVANPGSGTTVNTVVEDLPSDEMDFRVRASFGDCFTDWTVVTPDS